MKDRHEVEDEARFAELEMEPDAPAPEFLALHVVDDDGPNRVLDPELALLAADGGGGPEYHFADEEFEGRAPRRRRDEHEPDLEELLEQQHYAFAEEHGAVEPE